MLVITLLLIATTGFSISKHYCGTTFVSVVIDKEADFCCGDDSAGCCHNEDIFFQVKDDFVLADIQFNFENSFLHDVLFSRAIPFSISTVSDNTDVIVAFNESPPPPLIQTILSSLQTYRL